MFPPSETWMQNDKWSLLMADGADKQDDDNTKTANEIYEALDKVVVAYNEPSGGTAPAHPLKNPFEADSAATKLRVVSLIHPVSDTQSQVCLFVSAQWPAKRSLNPEEAHFVPAFMNALHDHWKT